MLVLCHACVMASSRELETDVMQVPAEELCRKEQIKW